MPVTSTSTGQVRAPLRGVRASVVAVFTVVVAATCHSLGGAMMASPAALTFASLCIAPLCWYASARRWTIRELVAVFILAQGVLHLWCTATTSMPDATPYPAWLMVAAHAGATVVSVAAVRGADAAVWLLTELAAALARVGCVLRVACGPLPRRVSFTALVVALPPSPTSLSAYGVRGPPLRRS